MRIPRIFLDQELTKNKTYKLDKESFHHLLVIKKREGDKIELFNSKGQFLIASISSINKKTCEVFSTGETKIQKKTFPKISLGISEIKNFEPKFNRLIMFDAEKHCHGQNIHSKSEFFRTNQARLNQVFFYDGKSN